MSEVLFRLGQAPTRHESKVWQKLESKSRIVILKLWPTASITTHFWAAFGLIVFARMNLVKLRKKICLMSDVNGYSLSRSFWDFSFENPHKMKPIHGAIYFFAIEHCNRLGWKKNFGFPSQMVMEAIGVKNWRTYNSGLQDLVNFGFIEMIETSKNQYSSNIIAIVNFTKAHTKALDKALDKALSKHSTKHCQSTVSIDKQLNKEQLNKRFSPPNLEELSEYIQKYQIDNPDKVFDSTPQKFVDFYQSKGWKVGSQSMKDWQAAVRTWMKAKEVVKPKTQMY